MPDRRGPLTALATAACVLAVLEAQQVVGGAATAIAALLYGQHMSIMDTLGGPTLVHNLVFAVGVFFALWLIVPIAADFRLTRVILRGLAISALATALLFVILGPDRQLHRVRRPAREHDRIRTAIPPVSGLGDAFLVAGNYFAEGTPLVALAVVLLWIWLRRRARATDV